MTSETGEAGDRLVLHATWHAARRIALWGETDPGAAAPSRRPARRPRPGRAPRHPFAAGAGELRRTVLRIGGPGILASAETSEIALTLPSDHLRPTPSPWAADRQAGRRVETAAGSRAAWEVAALELAPRAAHPVWEAVLDGSAARRAEPAGTILFLARMWRIARALVERGAIAPELVDAPGGPEARWSPLPSSGMDALLGRLTGAMPRSIVAHADPFGDPILAAELDRDRSVVSDILAACVDAHARRRLALARGAHALPDRGFDPNRMSAEDAWLAALAADDPAVRGGEPAEVARLRTDLDAWIAGHWRPKPRVKACIRLREPAVAGEPNPAWRLELGVVDPERGRSFRPASEVWRDRAPGDAAAEAREALLTGLGGAIDLFPEIAAHVREAPPDSIQLDTGAAYRFLRDVTPLLRDRAVAVVVPVWWSRDDGRRLSVTLTLRSEDGPPPEESRADGGTPGLVRGNWRVSLGGRALTRADLTGMAGRPLVEVDGRWTRVTPEQVDAAIAVLDRPRDRPIRLTEALRLSIATGPLPIAKLETTGRLKQILEEGRPGKPTRLAAPDGFKGSLRPYQEEGLGWLCLMEELGLGALLADDMGLGKTIQALALVACDIHDHRRMLTRNGAPEPHRASLATLVVSPTSVLGGWIRESERFVPHLRVHVHHGPDRHESGGLAEHARRADLVLTTYSTATRDADLIRSVGWRRLVLDEAQMLKNPATRQRRALASIRAPRRIALTGTPVENRLSDLWSIMDILNPGLLGTEPHFRRRFAWPIERMSDGQATADLKRLTSPFTLRRTKSDRRIVRELPEKMELREYCTITREQADLYAAIAETMLSRADGATGIARRGHVLTGILRLKQVLNHPAHVFADGGPIAGRSGKLDRLETLLDEVIASGERALVFTQFARTGRLLADYLPAALGCELLHFDGSTPRPRREEAIAAFSDAGGAPIFVMSLRAGGLGLNLTAASHVIHFDRWWNPAVEDQATDRAHRIGQRRRVQVRKLISIGTLEERIDRMIEEKRELADAVTRSDGWLTEMTTRELRDIVRLAEESVA